MKRSGVKDPPPETQRLGRVHRMVTASWTRGEDTYVLPDPKKPISLGSICSRPGFPFPEPGRDAFHRVPFFSGEVTDAVKRVPTRFRGARRAVRGIASWHCLIGRQWEPLG